MAFSSDWLALRTDADRRARDKALEAALVAALAERPRPLRVLDLGSGTGANLHALVPVLGPGQVWVLTDNDPALLAQVRVPPGIPVTCRAADLAGDLEGLFDPAPDLVTASAFFDLCGAEIAGRIAAATARTGAAFYTVLTYDGRETWAPPHALDADILTAFHADQRRDKGLGRALGPDAVGCLAEVFRALGYRVSQAPSDWILTAPGDAPLIAALAEGAAHAVGTRVPAAPDWARARRAASRVTIGHQDLLAIPGTA